MGSLERRALSGEDLNRYLRLQRLAIEHYQIYLTRSEGYPIDNNTAVLSWIKSGFARSFRGLYQEYGDDLSEETVHGLFEGIEQYS